jgi:hypothetical protein
LISFLAVLERRLKSKLLFYDEGCPANQSAALLAAALGAALLAAALGAQRWAPLNDDADGRRA